MILLLTCCVSRSAAQTDDGEDLLTAHGLALDTSVSIAKRFCEAIGSLADGYSLAFIDNETRYAVRYVYKNQKNESLRIDYRFTMEAVSDDDKSPKRPVVTYQRISGELNVITKMYNFIFGASLTPERVMNSSTQGTQVKYRDRTGNFTFLQDDYEPGYWVMTFVR